MPTIPLFQRLNKNNPSPVTVTQYDPERARRDQFYRPWSNQMMDLRSKRQQNSDVDILDIANKIKNLYGPNAEIDPNELVDAARGLIDSQKPVQIPGKQPGTRAYQSALENIGNRKKFDMRVQARTAARDAVRSGDVESVRQVLGRQDVEYIGIGTMTLPDGTQRANVPLWKLGDTTISGSQMEANVYDKADRAAVGYNQSVSSEDLGSQKPTPRLPSPKEKPEEMKYLGNGMFQVGVEVDAEGNRIPKIWKVPEQSKAGWHTEASPYGVVTYQTDETGQLVGTPTFYRRQEEPVYDLKTGTYYDAKTGKEQYGLWSFQRGKNEPPTLIHSLREAPRAQYYVEEIVDPKTGKTQRIYYDQNNEPMVDQKGRPITPLGEKGGEAPGTVKRSRTTIPISGSDGGPLMTYVRGKGMQPLQVPVTLYTYPDGTTYYGWSPEASDYLTSQAAMLRNSASNAERGGVDARGNKIEPNPDLAKQYRDMAGRLEEAAKQIKEGSYEPGQPTIPGQNTENGSPPPAEPPAPTGGEPPQSNLTQMSDEDFANYARQHPTDPAVREEIRRRKAATSGQPTPPSETPTATQPPAPQETTPATTETSSATTALDDAMRVIDKRFQKEDDPRFAEGTRIASVNGGGPGTVLGAIIDPKTGESMVVVKIDSEEKPSLITKNEALELVSSQQEKLPSSNDVLGEVNKFAGWDSNGTPNVMVGQINDPVLNGGLERGTKLEDGSVIIGSAYRMKNPDQAELIVKQADGRVTIVSMQYAYVFMTDDHFAYYARQNPNSPGIRQEIARRKKIAETQRRKSAGE